MWKKKAAVNSNSSTSALACTKGSCSAAWCSKKANFGVQTQIANLGCIEDAIEEFVTDIATTIATEIATEISVEEIDNYITNHPNLGDDGSFATDGSGNRITSNATGSVGSSTYPSNLGIYSTIAGAESRCPADFAVVNGAFASVPASCTGGMAMGFSATIASGSQRSTAIGAHALADTGFNNFVAGIGARLRGFESVVVGNDSGTTGDTSYSAIVGYGSNTTSDFAAIVGHGNNATVSNVNIVGSENVANFPNGRVNMFGWGLIARRSGGNFFSERNNYDLLSAGAHGFGLNYRSPRLYNAAWQTWTPLGNTNYELTANLNSTTFEESFDPYLVDGDIDPGTIRIRKGTITYGTDAQSMVQETLYFGDMSITDTTLTLRRFSIRAKYLYSVAAGPGGFDNDYDVHGTWSFSDPITGNAFGMNIECSVMSDLFPAIFLSFPSNAPVFGPVKLWVSLTYPYRMCDFV